MSSTSESEADPIACQACKLDSDDASMLLCDGCDQGYHLYCLRPKMDSIPKGRWFCKECSSKKDTKWRASLQPGASVRAQDRAGDWLESKKVEWKETQYMYRTHG